MGLASDAVLRYQVAACEDKETGSLLSNLPDHLNASDEVEFISQHPQPSA